MRYPPPASFHHAQGAALIVALLMLMIIVMLGISAANIALQSEQIARSQRDRQIAFAAAEAALLDAQMDLEGARKKHVFPVASTTKPADSCTASGDYLGLCNMASPGHAPVWETIQWMNDAPSVQYGQFSGKVFPYGSSSLPVKAPRYIIESLQPGQVLDDALALYRITSIGFGARVSTQVVLQVVYRKKNNSTGSTPGNDIQNNTGKLDLSLSTSVSSTTPQQTQPSQVNGRLSWREIINWQEINHRIQP